MDDRLFCLHDECLPLYGSKISAYSDCECKETYQQSGSNKAIFFCGMESSMNGIFSSLLTRDQDNIPE